MTKIFSRYQYEFNTRSPLKSIQWNTRIFLIQLNIYIILFKKWWWTQFDTGQEHNFPNVRLKSIQELKWLANNEMHFNYCLKITQGHNVSTLDSEERKHDIWKLHLRVKEIIKGIISALFVKIWLMLKHWK
jgi:hypothetical protein